MSENAAPRENIVLIGFMGSGKSTVGRLLAKTLRFQFIDTDHVIEERARMEIRDIFSKHGEAYFRDRETTALESLLHKRRHVIATGGGIVTQQKNFKFLRELGWVVLLKADPETIYERVARNKNRPLLKVANPHAAVLELMAQREAMYQEVAQFTVDSSALEMKEVASIIAEEARRVFGWKQHSRT